MRKLSHLNQYKKAMKFVYGVFQGKVLSLNINLCLSFTRQAEIATLMENNFHIPSLFTNFKIPHKNTEIVIFTLKTESLVVIC